MGSELRVLDIEADALRPGRGEGGTVLRSGAIATCSRTTTPEATAGLESAGILTEPT